MPKILIWGMSFSLIFNSYADPKFKGLIDKYCLECHGGRKTKGGVDFKDYKDLSHIYNNHEIWKDAITQVTDGDMPPDDEAQMSAEEKKYFLDKLNKVFDNAEKIEFTDPGPSPLRRLTKIEYNNTIRDIFGIDLQLGKEFPSEGGGGEGFDNNAEVMNFSPLMFEKYIKEAQKLTKHLNFSFTSGFQILAKKVPLRNDPQMKIYLRAERDGISNSVFPPQFKIETYLRDYMYAARELILENKIDDKSIWEICHKKKMNPIFVKKMIAYLNDTNSKNEIENKFLTKWYALTDNSTEKEIKEAGKQFLDGYKRSRYINEHTTPEPKEPYRYLVRNVRKKVFHLTHEEIISCLTTEDQKRYDVLNNEYNIQANWHKYEIEKLLKNSFKNFDNEKKKKALKEPEKYLNKKSIAKLKEWREKVNWSEKNKKTLAKAHIKNLASKAFRRPATELEVDEIAQLFNSEYEAKGSQEAARMVLVRIFCSPAFLFRVEEQKKDIDHYRISNNELAVRLSYFLWASLPDQELLSLAEKGKLFNKEVLDRQVDRMLKSPKSRSLAENFASQWLHFKDIKESVELDQKRFPEFTKELANDMFKECVKTIDYIIQNDLSVLNVIDSNFVFANDNIAKIYGLKNIKGKDFRKVEIKDKRRGGLVTSPAVMAMTSYPLRTSPVLRGEWIIAALLGTPTPPPPDDVELLPEDDAVADGLTVKQRFEKHREDPTCHSCHSRLDPMGFPLEVFDSLGRLRTMSGGHKIDATGELKNGNIINGPQGLKNYLLSKKSLFLENLVSKALGYSLGRSLEFFDRYTIKQAVNTLEKNNYKFSAMVKSIVHSRLFQYRRGNIQAKK